VPGDGRVDLTAVHDQAKGFAEKVEQLRRSRRPGQPIQIKRAAPPERELDSEMEGVMIPADLRPRAAVQKVLNQVTGKLSWKELKRQMADSGVLPEEQDVQVLSLLALLVQKYKYRRRSPRCLTAAYCLRNRTSRYSVFF
jgi:hypothetical protein